MLVVSGAVVWVGVSLAVGFPARWEIRQAALHGPGLADERQQER
jgi:hypothetical protein